MSHCTYVSATSLPSSMCGPSSQTSKGCGDPPETPAPTAPETETDNTRPDVLPSLYDDINTLTREVFLFQLTFAHLMELYVHTQKKEQPLSMPMYHVLEGPTPVESTPETQEQEVCTLYTIHPAPVHKLSIVHSNAITPFTARVQRQIFHFTLWWTRVKRKRRRLCRLIQLEM